METGGKSARAVAVVAGYALASSSLAVINKWALVRFDFPNALLIFQLGFASLSAWLVGMTGSAYVDPITWDKTRRFLPAVLFFYAACFTNVKLLQHVNVDTFIVVRSCSPLVVFAVDTVRGARARGRELHLPERPMLCVLALVATSFGAVQYAGAASADLTIMGCVWSAMYLACISASNVLVKEIVQRVPMSSWGLVLYNNALSLVMAPLSVISSAELAQPMLGLAHTCRSLLGDLPSAMLPVLASCLVGTCISWFGLQARQALSPTSFTVVGVVNKGLTVAANILVWDRHSSPHGTFWLLVCIMGALGYELAARAQPRNSESVRRKRC